MGKITFTVEGATVGLLGTAFVAEGTITNSGATVLPQATDLLASRIWRANNAAAAVAIAIVNVYIETDW